MSLTCVYGWRPLAEGCLPSEVRHCCCAVVSQHKLLREAFMRVHLVIFLFMKHEGSTSTSHKFTRSSTAISLPRGFGRSCYSNRARSTRALCLENLDKFGSRVFCPSTTKRLLNSRCPPRCRCPQDVLQGRLPPFLPPPFLPPFLSMEITTLGTGGAFPMTWPLL